MKISLEISAPDFGKLRKKASAAMHSAADSVANARTPSPKQVAKAAGSAFDTARDAVSDAGQKVFRSLHTKDEG